MLSYTVHMNGESATVELDTVEQVQTAVWAVQRFEGVYVRFPFETAVALIDAGAFDQAWWQLRRDAIAQLEELHKGSGCGISSSDVNHTVVGLVQGRPVSKPESGAVGRISPICVERASCCA